MTDLTHLNALEVNLSHERVRLSQATAAQDIALRKVWVAQLEREVADEYVFLGIAPTTGVDLSVDELLAELQS